MPRPRFLFFDVGNTLLFPNRAKMLEPLPSEHHPTLAQWQALERRTKHDFDTGMMAGSIDHGFWWTFHSYLIQELTAKGVELDRQDAVRDCLVENTRLSANWDQILPGTFDALERLRQA